MKKFFVFVMVAMLLVGIFAVNAGALTDKQKEIIDYAKGKDVKVDITAQINQVENYCEGKADMVLTDDDVTKAKKIIDEIVDYINKLVDETNAKTLQEIGNGSLTHREALVGKVEEAAAIAKLNVEVKIEPAADNKGKTATVIFTEQDTGSEAIKIEDVVKKTGGADYTLFIIAGIVVLAAAAFVTTRKLRATK